MLETFYEPLCPSFGWSVCNTLLFSALMGRFLIRYRISITGSVRLSIHLSVRPSVHPSVRSSICLSVHPSVRLSIGPSHFTFFVFFFAVYDYGLTASAQMIK